MDSSRITVVNKHHGAQGIYVGRGSALGNPYSSNSALSHTITAESREHSVAMYEKWLRNMIKMKDPAVTGMLNSIWSKAKQENVNLVCFCAPKLCHADIIKKIIEEKL